MSCLMLLSVAWIKAQKATYQIYRGFRLGEKIQWDVGIKIQKDIASLKQR